MTADEMSTRIASADLHDTPMAGLDYDCLDLNSVASPAVAIQITRLTRG
jgi:hypothetical protein